MVRFLAFAVTKPKEQSWWHVLAGATLYSAPLTLLVVIANLGLNLKLVDASFHATVILLAVVSSTVYPFLFKIILKKLPPSAKKE